MHSTYIHSLAQLYKIYSMGSFTFNLIGWKKYPCDLSCSHKHRHLHTYQPFGFSSIVLTVSSSDVKDNKLASLTMCEDSLTTNNCHASFMVALGAVILNPYHQHFKQYTLTILNPSIKHTHFYILIHPAHRVLIGFHSGKWHISILGSSIQDILSSNVIYKVDTIKAGASYLG